MVDSAVDKDAQVKSSFLLDNGATASAVISTCYLTCLEVCEGQVKTASGDFLPITSKGLLNLRHIGSFWVYVVPGLVSNILSVNDLQSVGCTVTFLPNYTATITLLGYDYSSKGYLVFCVEINTIRSVKSVHLCEKQLIFQHHEKLSTSTEVDTVAQISLVKLSVEPRSYHHIKRLSVSEQNAWKSATLKEIGTLESLEDMENVSRPVDEKVMRIKKIYKKSSTHF